MKYMSAIALTAFLCASCDLDIFPQMGYNQGNVEDVVVNEDTGEVSQYKSRGDMESLRNAIYSSWLKGNVIQEGILLDGMVYAECRADNAFPGSFVDYDHDFTCLSADVGEKCLLLLFFAA